MKLAQTLTAVYCVIRVVWCRDFSITLPKTVEAVSGLCVAVPCQFEIPEQYDYDLDLWAKGIWRKDDNNEQVFDSTTPENNKIKGVMADVQTKNCTTVSTKISTADRGTYHFRLEGGGWGYLKYSYKQPYHQTVTIKVDDHKQTLILTALIFTALLLLSLAVIGFLTYKLKQLSIRTKALKVEGDTYASLQLSDMRHSRPTEGGG